VEAAEVGAVPAAWEAPGVEVVVEVEQAVWVAPAAEAEGVVEVVEQAAWVAPAVGVVAAEVEGEGVAEPL
jgi:hypothetical protein